VACSKAVCFATGNQIQLYNESYTEHLATVTLGTLKKKRTANILYNCLIIELVI